MAAMSLLKHIGCGEAYIVGSALRKCTRPRDVDVRIVLEDDDFHRRYGLDLKEWSGDLRRFEWPRSDAWWAYRAEVNRFEDFIRFACGENNIDLGVVPRTIFDHHLGDPRERIGVY